MAIRSKERSPARRGALTTLSGAPGLEGRSLENAIGSRVRALRRERDLSAVELSAAAGLSAGMLSKIENGQISPSLSSLDALARALNVPLTSLFAVYEERRDCSFVPAGKGLAIERRGTKVGHAYQLLGHGIGGSIAVEPYLIRLAENAEPYTGFQHGGTEFIFMLRGKVSYRVGDIQHDLRPGDSLMFDSGALLGPARMADHPVEFLSIITNGR
jgi:transcriptional regulator with XRE-family HTH domain